jgi:RNA polymerase sigma factor (sigma-70 family)
MEAVLERSEQTLEAGAGSGPQDVAQAFASQQARLQRFVRSRIGDSADVEDIVQEVFYELTAADRLMQPIGQLAAWLLRVARNRIIDRFRKRERERRVMVSLDEHEAEADRLLETLALPEHSGPDADYARAALADSLEEALSELPSEQRAVFVAHEIDGRSFKELAAASGVSINTLLSRKHAAVRSLRARMRDLYDELFD